MTPRVRVWLLVAAAALAAAGLTVGVTLATRSEVPDVRATTLRPGTPPLVLDLGVRIDAEARALRRAAALYDRGKRAQARRIFAGLRSVEAQLGAALAAWPSGRTRALALATEQPRSAMLQLHRGLVLYWQREELEAQTAWRRAKELAPDSLYAVRAGDLLHPELPVPGLPQFVPGFSAPPGLARLAPPRQYAILRARARAGDARAKLLYGVALQRLGRPVSARREFEAAAALAPDDPEARTAVAVGFFDKDDPSRTFSRLGPLARSFPKAATVRFHLGLCLVWLGQVEAAKSQFRLAVKQGGASPLGQQAQAFLDRLGRVGR